MVTLLIADDHQLFRRGLRRLCEVNGGFTVLAEADNGAQAVALAHEYQPDVILMDIRMPGLTGVEATRLILQDNPAARILVLTMYHQDHYVTNAIKAGACGYLLKECSEDILFAAIHAVARGEGWIDSPVAATVLAEFARLSETAAEPATLTETELEIVRLVARGAENQAIADQLNMAKGTVANHLREIFSKLGVSNRTEVALYALRQGWASLDGDD